MQVPADVWQDLRLCGPGFLLLIVAVGALWRRMVRLEKRLFDYIVNHRE